MALFCRSIVSNFPLHRLPLQLIPLNTSIPSPLCPPKSHQITALPLVLRRKITSFASLPSQPPSTMENPPEGYRRNVGICLMNSSNKKVFLFSYSMFCIYFFLWFNYLYLKIKILQIFAASRLDIPSAWQMPQVNHVDSNCVPIHSFCFNCWMRYIWTQRAYSLYGS